MTNSVQTKHLCACVLALAIVSAGTDAKDAPSPDSRVSTTFIDTKGDSAGSVVLTETKSGVLLEVEMEGLSPGWHGFHVHETGQCKTPDFKSAGGHFNPGNTGHGFLARKKPHAGDMPNIFVGDDGKARFQFLVEDVTLRDGKRALLDKDGSAIMVHSKADDFRSQPSGDAGDRVACAEAKRDKG